MRRKKRSYVWDHCIVVDEKNVLESCGYCGEVLAPCESDIVGALTNHLIGCKKRPHDVDKKQNTLDFPPSEDVKFRIALAKFIIIDELPFRLVEREGFRSFCALVQPNFVVPSRWTVARDCLALYINERKKVKEMLSKVTQRISLTIETWVSSQGLSYMSLMAHFIDDDWKLQKRMLSFCQISSHSGEVIGRAVERCLLDWGIDNVFTVTMAGTCSNNVEIQYLKRRLNSWGKSVLENEFLYVRSCAHILSRTVKEVLVDSQDSISRIRAAVRYVRSSPASLQKFKSCIAQEKIDSTNLVCLDVPTRWDSTYLMLEAALMFQKAFELLELQDANYRDELTQGERMEIPLASDWDYAHALLPTLQIFYDATLHVCGFSYITSNTWVQQIYGICLVLDDMCESEDVGLSLMASKLKRKNKTYSDNIDEINIMLFIATILDPRYKLDYVNWVINKVYDFDKANALCGKVHATLFSMFEQYTSIHKPSVQQAIQVANSDEIVVGSFMRRYKRYIAEKLGLDNKSELDRYLEEQCENYDGDDKLNILDWWKVNSSRYRVLSIIARDVLAMPVSNIASGFAFNIGNRMLDSFRSSLTPRIVEALVCAQDWLRASPVSLGLEENLDELEKLESDLTGLAMEPALLDD